MPTSYGSPDSQQESKVSFLNISDFSNLDVQLEKKIREYHEAIAAHASKIQKTNLDQERAFVAFYITYESFLNFGYSKFSSFHNEVLKSDQYAYQNFLDYRSDFDDDCSWKDAVITTTQITISLINFDIPNKLAQKIDSSLNTLHIQSIGQLRNIMGHLQSIHGNTSEQVGENLEVAAKMLVINELAKQQQLFIEVFQSAYSLLEKIPNIEDKAQRLTQTISDDRFEKQYLQYATSIFTTFKEHH